MIRRMMSLAAMTAVFLAGAMGVGQAGSILVSTPTIHYDSDGGASVPAAPDKPWSLMLARGVTAQQTPTPAATVVAAKPTAAPTVRPSTAASSTKPHYVVVMVLDGARPEYLNVPGIPHVRALMQKGTVYTNAIAGVLESETPTGHATIGTGMAPNQNGILGFGWVTGANNWQSVFDPRLIQSHVMEGLMSHAPSLAQRLHQSNRKIKVAAVGSYKYYANDALGGPDGDYTMYYTGLPDGKYAPVAVAGHVPPASLLKRPDLIAPTTKLPLGASDRLAMQLAMDTFTTTRAQVIMLNIPEFDYPVGHFDGANRDMKDITFLMQQFDQKLGQMEDVYRKAGVLGQTTFVITADHGFQPFDHIVSPDTINNAVASMGLTVTHGSYESGDYLWVGDHARANEAAAAIAGLQNPGIQSVYFKEQTAAGFHYVRATGEDLFLAPGMEAANQLLLNSFVGPVSPDVVVLFRQGYDGVAANSGWKGDHGGADWESQHIPLVFSGPGIKQGVVSAYPARLVDVAPTILSLLGANPHGLTGIPLADALTQPPTGSGQQQTARSGPLTAAVTALSTESSIERANE